MAEVSIIVPVYQVEKYIRQCVDSILAQTFKDFELILVDDGSTDKSGEICDEYAKVDGRVKVIHQTNRGVAAARNNAVRCAEGAYICFVDADDWIEDTMIENCVNHMEAYDADVLRHGYTMEVWQDSGCQRIEKKSEPFFAEYLTNNQIAEQMENFWKDCSNYVWNYFFRKETVGHIEFPEIKISEDHIFVLKVLQECKKICYLREEPYHYCMRMGSSANRWQEEGIDCQLQMIQSCHEFMEHFGISGDRKERILSNIIISAYSYVIYLLSFPDCKWSVQEKINKIKEVREELEVEKYTSYVITDKLPLADRIKQKLICKKKEKLLILIGPVFLKTVRKVKS